MVRNCTECGINNPASSKFCKDCGAELPKGIAVLEPRTPEIPESQKLKIQWKKGEIGDEEYRSKLLDMKLRKKFMK
jgi:uncharacterized membrane protein YvbJ